MASEHQFLYGAAALSIAVLYILCRALFDPLRTIPGPFITRFTRGWYFLKLWNEDFEKTNIDIHRRYGKVVRIAPNEYSIDDPSAVKTIYGLGSQFPKAEWYWGFANPFQIFETIFTTRDVSYHNSMRRAAQNHYQMSTLVGYEGYVDDCGQLLTMRLEEISEAGISANLGEWLQKYAFDVIGEITFGNRFGFLDSGEDIGGLIGALEKRRVFSSLSGIYPFWHKLACHIMSKIPGSGAAGFLYLNRFGSEKIEQRKAEVKANPNLEVGPVPQVDRFLKAHMERPDSYPTHAIYLGCMANILAGSDTTGISLAAIVNNLCRHPESLQKLRAEIDNAAAEGRLSDPVVFKETQSMLYLNAVIKGTLQISYILVESLRIF
ncbi:MAG: hypothetical protein M1820_010179 [Bogoriella megaspora]|nr:MAG: hypothetical protein M1820_010179 [Bogoriella megaspora]